MAVNIYGPGLTGDQATASRPSQQNTGSGVDLWFKDCSSDSSQDGTRLRAQFLNFIIANLRNAVRGMGVAESEIDDDMLLKCFQKLQFSDWLNLPIYPETLTSDAKLGITNLGAGQIRIDSGQEFLHRGWKKIATNDYSDANRTLAHSANKTYHVRWQYNAGSPIFVIKDTADGVYNPGALAETDVAFDTVHDDMLIAKVVTDGSNVPTITSLKNKARLILEFAQDYTMNLGSGLSKRVAITYTYDWARKPSMFVPTDAAYCGGTINHIRLYFDPYTGWDMASWWPEGPPYTNRYKFYGGLVYESSKTGLRINMEA